MKCEIKWNSLSLIEWEERFGKIKRSNFLQSYDYAMGACRFYRQKVRWGLIFIDGNEAGLVQVFEAGLFFNLLHGVILDRGPIWFDNFGNAIHIQAFLREIQNEFPKRFGRKCRFLLEIEDGASANSLIKQSGLKHNSGKSSYETYWLDLTLDNDQLRENLNRKWRNKLNRAEEANIQIEWDFKGVFYPFLYADYVKDKLNRNYSGISPQFLNILAPFLLKNKNMIIGRAIKNGEEIANVMFIKHGRSATYQIGVTSQKGRKNNAHHLLLWQGLSVLKDRGICELDLGGINDESAEGIKQFKKAMGGEFYRLVGHYY